MAAPSPVSALDHSPIIVTAEILVCEMLPARVGKLEVMGKAGGAGNLAVCP